MHDDPSTTRKHATTRADIAKLHEFEHWPARWIWPMFIAMLALGGAAAAAAEDSCWQLLLVILPIQSALMFVFVLSFHDASHGRLHPVHRMNEAFGHVLGTVMFIPLNVYRFAHARHHAQLGRSNGVMSGQAKKYTNPEIKELASYISSLPGELKTVPESMIHDPK